MPIGMVETPINICSQLQQWLEGEAILVSDILKMDIPLEIFFDGNFVQSLSEATEEHRPS
jgi:hypothetical protein